MGNPGTGKTHLATVLGIAACQQGKRVRFYADAPYFLRFGLPSWLGHIRNPKSDNYIQNRLMTLSERHLARHIVKLTSRQVKAKVACARHYTAEFEAINKDFEGAVSNEALVCF